LFKKRKANKKPTFAVGDAVKVRSKEEIAECLDNLNKQDGCLFMSQMWDYCGQKFEVMNAVTSFFDEHQYKMFKPQAPLYILEGLLCNGVVEAFDHRCDRSCYLLWHEEWLEKA
jgi:hypothetical protein